MNTKAQMSMSPNTPTEFSNISPLLILGVMIFVARIILLNFAGTNWPWLTTLAILLIILGVIHSAIKLLS